MTDLQFFNQLKIPIESNDQWPYNGVIMSTSGDPDSAEDFVECGREFVHFEICWIFKTTKYMSNMPYVQITTINQAIYLMNMMIGSGT